VLDSDDALKKLVTSPDGLTPAEAGNRLEAYGKNRLTPATKRGPWKRFLCQFHNVLIYVLLAAAVVTAGLEHWIDTGVIIAVVVVNALIGFIQEGKAEKALEAIRELLSHEALVKRAGRLERIPAEQLVPGDIVQLQSGDKVPADLRLFRAKDLRIEEAMLTGESVPAEKSSDTMAADAVIGDRFCIAYSGTLVTYGQASGVVIATGDQTEIGRISALLSTVPQLTTPLLRRMADFAKWLTVAILVVAVVTFVFGTTARDYGAVDMLLAAVGLAVAAIPEGLPAIMTITLAIGVQRMARRNAIIRRLPVVEALGSVTVICSDKTGTLTRNEMTVQSVATASGLFDVDGVGYRPHGILSLNGEGIELEDYPILEEVARAGVLCNDAEVDERDGQWVLQGDPTEGSLVTFALKAGLDIRLQRNEWPRTDLIPFESEHRFMATLHHDHAGHAFVYVKGAPERILDMCNTQRMRGVNSPLDTTYWRAQIDAIARRGQRLIAIGFKPVEEPKQALHFSDLEDRVSLLGVVGIIDPPRAEAITAVQQCRSAGIRVKMITGDHAVTAAAIGSQMGIGEGKQVLTGDVIDKMDDGELIDVIEDVDVFARTSPEHKLRLVMALQSRGHVVAMTGDGVNDAPALRRADVGVAMGQKGTEVAKEAGEMVLIDDNFASIAHAVEEGRTVYDNIKKAILFILPTNGGEALSVMAAIAMGRVLPITPIQILWINMITAVTLALALAFEPPEAGVMRRVPRNPRESLLSPLLIWRVVFVSLVVVSGTFGLFLWERTHGAPVDFARTVAVNTLVMFEIFYLLNTRYLLAPVTTVEGMFGNHYVWIAIGLLVLFQLSFTHWGWMQILFGTTDIEVADWVRITVVASSVFVLVEIEKFFVRRFVADPARGRTGPAARTRDTAGTAP
jgi:magnesium-transporting ATPase (P-type)